MDDWKGRRKVWSKEWHINKEKYTIFMEQNNSNIRHCLQARPEPLRWWNAVKLADGDSEVAGASKCL